jgi:hypothetical protein
VSGQSFMETERDGDVRPPGIAGALCDLFGDCGIAVPFGPQYALMEGGFEDDVTTALTQPLPAGFGAQWAAVVDPAIPGGCQGAEYTVPTGVWDGDDRYSASLELLTHAGPSTVLAKPSATVAQQPNQGLGIWGCFSRGEDDNGNVEINNDRPGQPLILRQSMLMRSPGPPSSADQALR